MQRGSELRRRYTAAITLGLVLVATVIAVTWHHRWARSATILTSISTPPVITIAWRAVGQDVEPWSGVGLGEQVRQALNARGVVVTDGGALPGALSPEGTEDLATLGRRLHAAYVLGGTVGRKDGRSEIGMQLVRVEDRATVWTSTFWRDRTDLESLASDLALTVAQVLETEASQ